MAEFLCLAVDRPGCTLGDIVTVKPDGSEWGRLECLGDFVVVRVDMPLEEAQALACPLFRDAVNALMDPVQEMVSKFRHYVEWIPETDLPMYQHLATVDWFVPTIERSKIKDKAA